MTIDDIKDSFVLATGAPAVWWLHGFKSGPYTHVVLPTPDPVDKQTLIDRVDRLTARVQELERRVFSF